jgi:hypothetical protein
LRDWLADRPRLGWSLAVIGFAVAAWVWMDGDGGRAEHLGLDELASVAQAHAGQIEDMQARREIEQRKRDDTIGSLQSRAVSGKES